MEKVKVLQGGSEDPPRRLALAPISIFQRRHSPFPLIPSGRQRGDSASGQLRRSSRVGGGPRHPLPKSTQIYRSPRSSASGRGASLPVTTPPTLHLRAPWASRRLFLTAAVGPGSRRVAATQFRRKGGGSQHLRATREKEARGLGRSGKTSSDAPVSTGSMRGLDLRLLLHSRPLPGEMRRAERSRTRTQVKTAHV